MLRVDRLRLRHGRNGIIQTFPSGTYGAQSLTWTGSFWQRVRFEEDESEFEKFMEKLWSAQKITFVTRRL